jgi:hypothetical protein
LTRLPLVALGILAIRVAVLAAMLPPWQQPDEHVHVAVVEMWRAHFAGDAVADGRQPEILQSMATNGWWRHYTGGAPPDPMPSRFADGGGVAETIGVIPTRAAYPPLYYAAIGLALSPMTPRPVTADLSAMRVVSAVLALLTLWVGWRAATEALGPAAGNVVALMLALHPQFGIVSAAASPDAAVGLCGAVVFWMAVRLLTRPRAGRDVTAIWMAALMASAMDRSGVPLVVVAGSVSLIVTPRHLRLAVGAALAGLGVLAVATVPALRQAAAAQAAILPVARTRTLEYFTSFHRVLFDTWWFVAGWLRYRAPAWWLVAPLALAITTAVGVGRRAVGDAPARRIIALALGGVAVQAAAVYWIYYRGATGPQGRYLFPFITSSMCLLVIGIEGVVPVAYRPRALAGLMVVFAFLDSAAWETVILPAYAY